MKAIQIHSYGGPDVLVYEDAPRPQPSSNEVLVRVEAAGVNTTDLLTRAGYLRQRYELTFPAILGWDVAGIVESVGSAVTQFQVGEAVYGMHRGGAYAEYLTLPAAELAARSNSLDSTQAAAVPLSALTAWQAVLEAGRLAPGETVLIHGAAGNVGIYAVQLARWRGATVIGTVAGSLAAPVRELGADTLIDYTSARFEDAVPKVDLVLDTVGGETQSRSWGVLKPGGRLVSIVGLPDQDVAGQHGVQGLAAFVRPEAGQLAQIGELIDTGIVRPVVAATLPLSEARQAHERMQAGRLFGKIILQP